MPHAFDLKRLDTVQLVPPTPFSGDGKHVRGELLSQHTREMREAGITVFVPAAGTGEFQSLSNDEVIACIQATRDAAGDDATVIAPIGFSLENATQLGRRAADAGADALLSMPLNHPYLVDEGVANYLRTLRKAVPLPLLIYKRTGAAPSDQLLIQLGKEGVLAGVKYSGSDLNAFRQFVNSAPSQLGVYCGLAERLAPFFMLAGATGFTSGAANVAPRLSLELHRLLETNDFVAAMSLLEIFRPFEEFRARHGDSYNIASVKGSMQFRGHDFGPLRPPQRTIMLADQQAYTEIVTSLLAAEEAFSTALA